jgi:DNA-binding NtrC family response regulator
VRQRRPELSFILVTAYGRIEHAVEALKQPAPTTTWPSLSSAQALLLAVDKALRSGALRDENRRLVRPWANRRGWSK